VRKLVPKFEGSSQMGKAREYDAEDKILTYGRESYTRTEKDT
jgi:hypothetical protein